MARYYTYLDAISVFLKENGLGPFFLFVVVVIIGKPITAITVITAA